MNQQKRVRRPRRSGAVAILVCGLWTANPGLSSAATVVADLPCYAPGQRALITGAGYTPNGEVALGFNVIGDQGGRGSSTLLTWANGAGAIALRVRTPTIPLLESPATVLLSATDQEQAQQGQPLLATAHWKISIFNVFVFPWEIGVGDPGRRAQYNASGFTTAVGRTLYAHYVRGGKLLKTVAVGRLKGPCGDLFKRARQFPFRPVPAGVYKIKLDASRHYPNNSPGRTFGHVTVSRRDAVR